MLTLLALLLGSYGVLGGIEVIITQSGCSGISDCKSKEVSRIDDMSSGSDLLFGCAFISGLVFDSQAYEFVFREKSSNAKLMTQTGSQQISDRYGSACVSFYFGSEWEQPEESFDNSKLLSEAMTFSLEFRLKSDGYSGSSDVVIGAVETDISEVSFSEGRGCDGKGEVSFEFDDSYKTNGQVLFSVCMEYVWISSNTGYRVEFYKLESESDSSGVLVGRTSKGYNSLGAAYKQIGNTLYLSAGNLGLRSTSIANDVEYRYRIKVLLYDSVSEESISKDSIVSVSFSDTNGGSDGNSDGSNGGLDNVAYIVASDSGTPCSSINDCISKYNENGYSAVINTNDLNDRLYICLLSDNYPFTNELISLNLYSENKAELLVPGFSTAYSTPSSWMICTGMQLSYYHKYMWDNPQTNMQHLLEFKIGDAVFTSPVSVSYQ